MITVLVLNFASRAAGRCHTVRSPALVCQLSGGPGIQRTNDGGAHRARWAGHDVAVCARSHAVLLAAADAAAGEVLKLMELGAR